MTLHRTRTTQTLARRRLRTRVTPAVVNPPRGNGSMPRRWAIGGLLAVLAGSALVAGSLHPNRWLVQRWRIEFAMLDEHAAAARVRQLPKLGLEGLPLLVDQLLDERPRVRQSALDTIEEQVALWKSQPLDDASRKAAILIGGLRLRASQIESSQRAAIEQLVMQLIRWPFHQDVDTPQILEDCEVILATFLRQSVEASLSNDPRASKDESTKVEESGGRSSGAAIKSGDRVETYSLSDESDVDLKLNSGGTDPSQSNTGEPGELMPMEVVSPLPPRTAQASDRDDGDDGDDIRAWSVVEVAEGLASDDARVGLRSAGELRRRGFTGVWISLVERLVDQDPRLRAEALRDLPFVPDFDATEWLVHLSGDPDTSVRRVAVAMMAGGTDPRVVHRLREMSTTERDPEVLRSIQSVVRTARQR